MNTVTVIIWLIGWCVVWAFYLACGVGVFYFWRKGELMPFVGCIAGAVVAAIPLLSLGM